MAADSPLPLWDWPPELLEEARRGETNDVNHMRKIDCMINPPSLAVCDLLRTPSELRRWYGTIRRIKAQPYF